MKLKVFQKLQKLKNRKYILLSLVIILLVSLFLFTFTKSLEIENHSKIETDSELTYYLKISYDGKDMNARSSWDSKVKVKVYSDYIYVTDKIPEGLIFQNFITGGNGSVGAVNPMNGSACLGSVLDDTPKSSLSSTNDHGLHYDKKTRTVSFRIKGLQAGCELTVGIVTRTPETVDDPDTSLVEKRRDFYNFATAREKNFNAKSNTVHTYMQDREVDLHHVLYKYEGVVPDNAPELPEDMQYAENATIGLAIKPKLDGYKFKGWRVQKSSGDIVSSTEENFVMPNEDVTVIGSFETVNKYTATFYIEGEIPEGYVVPSKKEYFEGQLVNISAYTIEGKFNEYRFLGWVSEDITINEYNEFEMPSKDIVIKGKFEKVKYKIRYEFTTDNGGVIPPDSDSLLPGMEEHIAGEKVKLPIMHDIPGYTFMGWYEGNDFEMPNEDIVIAGEWKSQNGVFVPTITKEIVDKKDNYEIGDIVKYKIVVANNAIFPIYDINILEKNTKAKFIKGSNYTLRTDLMVLIPTLNANSSIEIDAEYTVTADDKSSVVNEVEILSARADNDYNLDKSKEYKAIATFNIGGNKKKNLKICNTVDKGEGVFQYQLISKDNTFATWFTFVGNECKTLIVDDNEYEITQIPVQDYELIEVSGLISGNGETFTLDGEDNTITFVNHYKKKGFYHSVGRVVNMVKGKKNDS